MSVCVCVRACARVLHVKYKGPRLPPDSNTNARAERASERVGLLSHPTLEESREPEEVLLSKSNRRE